MEDLKQNTPYINPVTQKQYLLQNVIPGEGATMIDTDTHEESIIPEKILKNPDPTKMPLKPVLQQTNQPMNTIGATMEHDINDIVGVDTSSTTDEIKEHLISDIQNSIESIIEDSQLLGVIDQQHSTGSPQADISSDIDNEIGGDKFSFEPSDEGTDDDKDVSAKDEKSSKKEEDESSGKKETGGEESDTSGDGNKKEDSDDKEEKPNKESSKINPLLSTVKSFNIAPTRHGKMQNWLDFRQHLKTKSQVEAEKKAETQAKKVSLTKNAEKDIGFAPDERKAGPSGHATVNNIPMTINPGEKNKSISMSEFPKDHKPEEDYYGTVTMKEMDENQVANREKFNNEQRRLVPQMTVREYRDLHNGGKEQDYLEKGKGLEQERESVKPEKNTQYDIEKEAIARSLGLVSFSADDTTLPPDAPPGTKLPIKEGPIQHKPIKTAPKIDEYREPAIFEPAAGKVKEAITKLSQSATQLRNLQDSLSAEIKPLQDQIMKIQMEKNPDILKAQDSVKTYLEMLYKQLGDTADKVVYFGNEIWARISRYKEIKPAVTVQQVLVELDKTNAVAAEVVRKVQKMLESQQGGSTNERLLYEFPVAKDQEKRLKPEASLIVFAAGSSLVSQIASILADLASIDMNLSLILAQA